MDKNDLCSWLNTEYMHCTLNAEIQHSKHLSSEGRASIHYQIDKKYVQIQDMSLVSRELIRKQ